MNASVDDARNVRLDLESYHRWALALSGLLQPRLAHVCRSVALPGVAFPPSMLGGTFLFPLGLCTINLGVAGYLSVSFPTRPPPHTSTKKWPISLCLRFLPLPSIYY